MRFSKVKRLTYAVSGVFLIGVMLLGAVGSVRAAPSYTPYANSVSSQSGLVVGTANNAVGAPDGAYASLLGVNSMLTLDMGEGEEGTNTLTLYMGPIVLAVPINVAFLDANGAIISSETRSLFLNLAASTQTFSYDWHTSGKAYRFVRVTSTAGVGLGLDAVEALGFIGSSATQDTDGDGIPDRQDGNPLVADQSPVNNGGVTTTTTTTTTGGGLVVNNHTVTTKTPGGTSRPVNTPPAASSDLDGDQMDDAWEKNHNLDPTNKNDASTDPDHDGLTNLQEYQWGTDPHRMDTDGDGMPDGWEVTYGLNPLVNDAEQDPDGDYVTNLGEARYGTNPFKADAFRSALYVAPVDQRTGWDVASFVLIILGVLVVLFVAGVIAAAPVPGKFSSSWYRFRHRVYRVFVSRVNVD